jgi:signal transduction histidine kinase
MTTNNNRGTILIVDDIPANLEVLLEVLGSSGFEVLVAVDGQSAIEQVEYAYPDIILLDVVMPGIDGFETCRRLKENEKTREIPVIFMTALSETLDKVKGFELGAVDYITKPIHYEEVLVRVTNHLTVRNLQKRLQEQNVQLQQEIVERERVEEEQQKLIGELDAFAHTVAHDLKNPLGALLRLSTSLETYHTRMSAEEMEEYLHSITRAGQKATNIIEELMILSGVRKKDVIMEPLDMGAIVAAVQQRLSFMIEEFQPEIILPDTWPVALGYDPWVEEVWANYFSNALKYGGQPPRIELGATVLEESEDLVHFWILDNGPGLTLEEQTKLFTPFTRLSQARAEGHGLGLSIVQRIIEKLGGQVGVESDGRPGLGSVFYFTLSASTYRRKTQNKFT